MADQIRWGELGASDTAACSVDLGIDRPRDCVPGLGSRLAEEV
ncbi:hypothetical protein [Acidisoma sp. L85]|nr:hypothetical protein [Acidisoma sp. L85]